MSRCALLKPFGPSHSVVLSSLDFKSHLTFLKKGLSALKNKLNKKRQGLLAQASSPTEEETQWLGHEANLIDEELAIKALETASEYEKGLSPLVESVREESGGDCGGGRKAEMYVLFYFRILLVVVSWV